MRVDESEDQSRDEILPCMREDAGTQAAAKNRQQTEQRTEHGKQNHVARALISMRGAEQQSRAGDARNHRAACPRRELTMQIAAKYKLFRDTSENAESHPRDHFARIGGRNLGQSVNGLLLRRIGRELLAR